MAKWQIAIDHGGTFTDVWARELVSNRVLTLKLLSEDQEHYDELMMDHESSSPYYCKLIFNNLLTLKSQ